MKILIVASYPNPNTNNYIKYVAEEYQRQSHEIIFEEQNFLFSNFIPDIVHIQWPESIYKWKKLINENIEGLKILKDRLIWYKKNDVTLIQTIHNVIPHDISNDFDKKVYNLIFDYIDVLIHHGKSSISIINELYPQTKRIKNIIAPHGPYPKPNKLPSRINSRIKFNFPKDKTIISNFGTQRPYKGRSFFIDIVKNINTNDIHFSNIGLLMNGEKPFNDKPENVTEINKYLSASELDQVMAATDIILLCHSSGLNSGLISLSITYQKPIVFPDIGNFKDQCKGWDFYETYTVNELSSAIHAINRMIYKLNSTQNLDNSNWLKVNSWEAHVSSIMSLFNFDKFKEF